MVTFSRRTLLKAMGAGTALHFLGCGGVSDADARFGRSLLPVVDQLDGGVAISAFPARLRRDGEGLLWIRAANPGLRLEFQAASATVVRFGLENLPIGARLSGTAEMVPTGPGAAAVTVSLPAGATTLRLESSATGLVRFAVVSDIHDNHKSFGAIAADIRDWNPEFVACMGDFVQSGRVAEFDDMMSQLGQLERGLYTTIGNHELFGGAADRFEELLGATNHFFSWRGVNFAMLDTGSSMIAPDAYPWLEEKLATRPPGPTLAFTHIPPLDPYGFRDHAFRSREDAEHFLQLLGEARVDHLFVGHIHSYEEYSLRGIPVHLCGGGGGQIEKLTGVGHHYLRVSVNPEAADPIHVELRQIGV